jgi:MoaA/NifB/PqqE/SkfB family radical SAM enzyme
VSWEAWHEPVPGPGRRTDLSTLEALRLLNEVRCFGRIPLLLLGLPLRRGDLGVLVEHGARIGLSMRLAPGTDALTAYHTESLRDAGLQRVVFEADTRTPAALLQEVACARGFGLGVHVITRMDPAAREQIPALGRSLERAGVHVWTLTFPAEPTVPMLRGTGLDAALGEIATLAGELALQLEVAGAPQMRRVLHALSLPADLVSVAPAEGRGLLHIAADGSLQPAPALEIKVGSARHQDVVDAFRDAPLLCALRDPQRLGGKCRLCEYVAECGGSRTRAWCFTGDSLAPDPACGYQPPARRGGDSAPERSRQEAARPDPQAPARRGGDSAPERSRQEAARPDPQAPAPAAAVGL